MERMQYAESLVKEFLLYRGFSSTLRSFEAELSTDVSNGFQVDRVIELLFSIYVPKFEADNLRRFMIALKQSLVSRSETHYNAALRKLESSLNRYYIVNAVQKGRIDRVLEFFEKYGDLLLQSGDDWSGWFAIPYMKHPSSDPRFHVYFTSEWLETLMVSFGNFLAQAYDVTHLPKLLKLHNERLKFSEMKQELDQMQERCLQLQKELDAKEAPPSRRPSSVSVHDTTDLQQLSDSLVNETSISKQIRILGSRPNVEASLARSSSIKSHQRCSSRSYAFTKQMFSADDPSNSTKDIDFDPWRDNELFQDEPKGITSDFSACNFMEDKKFSEVAIESQETFSGHTSLITRCRFSSKGENIASASVDGTVRIWAPDRLGSTSKNATIYCGSEILSLEWEYKSDRLLLLGTSGGAIRVWNVDGKRVVCNLLSNAAFPRVLDLKCSPSDSMFLSATASEGHQGEGIEALGFGSLTVWNMRHWKPVNVLPLGHDPPAVTSVCFNHNGKIVAAGATDGMIRLFDMNGCQPITGWPVLDSCPVSCVRFGHDQASIWSLGSDGKLFEWSLHNQGQVLQSIDASSFSSSDASQLPRHEFALDGEGKKVLLTSNLNYSPIYSLDGSKKVEKTLEQGGPISSVDWHPTESVYATGSADHSVQVTMVR